jgi:prepilin-type N-terminal cleavage/methylation domain-containing protein
MNRPLQEKGYSLLEVMVALTLATVLAVAAFTVFFNSQRATGRVTKVIENRQNSRTAIQLLERDLRMAGSGWGRQPLSGCYDGAPLEIPSVQPGYGGSDASSDTLGIIGAWDQATTLVAAMPNPTSTLKVSSLAGFAVNDLCVVTDSKRAHLFQVTDINNGTSSLEHAATSKYNMTGGHEGWPSGGYSAAAKVYRVSWVSYRVDSTSARRPQLVRWQQNQAPQVVAYDVSQFTVSYLLQDSTRTREPLDLTLVDQVHPVLTMKTTVSQLGTATDSSWATVKPRSF